MSSYQYRCSDESILLPFLKKNVFSVLHRFIPYGVPANYLTLVSIFVIWSCFLYFIGIDTADEGDIIIAFFAIIIYVIFDHFDGLQAKITATGSPLGEILDHYSDVFNGSIILYLFFRILQIELDWIFYLAIWLNLVAFTLTYLEQSIQKELHFGKIGSLEGVVLILLIICSFMTSQGKTFWLENFTKQIGFPTNMLMRYRSINNKNPPSISNNKNSRKNPEGIFRIIRRRGKFSFGDFENNKSPPQAKIFRGILGLYQGGNGNFV